MNGTDFGPTRNRLRALWQATLPIALLQLLPAHDARAGANSDPHVSRATAADSVGDLAPTAAVPWNPERPVAGHERWESVVIAPVTLASLPFRLAGAGLRSGVLKVQQDEWIARAQLLIGLQPPHGIGVRTASLGDRTGFGGALFIDPRLTRGWLRSSLEGSTRRYGRGHVELGKHPIIASYTHDWRPQEPYYGLGMDAAERDASNYSLRGRRAEIRFAFLQAGAVRREWGAWVGERRTVMRRGRDSSRPSLEAVFPSLASQGFDVEQDHAIAGARLGLDTRRGHPHWSQGWRLAGQFEEFGHPLSGRGVLFAGRAASPAFSRITLEGETGLSFMRDPRTLRVSVRVVDTHPLRASEPLTLYDLPTLGGGNGLGGFDPGRFHDSDLAVARIAYVFPLLEHAELELSSERGGVFGDVWREPTLSKAQESYGVSFRIRTGSAPLAAIGFNWSREAVRLGFSVGGVE